MTPPIVAALVGAILVLMQVGFMLSAGLHRGKSGIGVGTGGDLQLERKVRRHGNLAENAALFVVVLALAEMTVVPDNVIKIVGAAFILGRIAHGIAFSSLAGSHGEDGSKLFPVLRGVGALGTVVPMIVIAAYLLAGIL